MGPRAGLDRCGKSRLPPTGIRSLDHPARSQSLYRLSYPGYRECLEELRNSQLLQRGSELLLQLVFEQSLGYLETILHLMFQLLTDEV